MKTIACLFFGMLFATTAMAMTVVTPGKSTQDKADAKPVSQPVKEAEIVRLERSGGTNKKAETKKAKTGVKNDK